MEKNITILEKRLILELKSLKNILSYFNIILLIIGSLGSMASFWGFMHKNLRNSKFNWYLLTLTVFEFLFCLISLIDYIFSQIHPEGLFLHDLDKIWFMIFDYAIHTIDSCTVVLTLLLSIDRLYAIKNPMKIKEFITNLHAKKTMTVSLIFVVLLKTSSFTFCELNTSIVYCQILSPTLFYTIPSITILIINAILAKKMVNINLNVKDTIQMENFNESTTLRRNAIDVSRHNTQSLNNQMRKFNKRNKSMAQKSHYIVIFVISLLSTLTSIPYCFI